MVATRSLRFLYACCSEMGTHISFSRSTDGMIGESWDERTERREAASEGISETRTCGSLNIYVLKIVMSLIVVRSPHEESATRLGDVYLPDLPRRLSTIASLTSPHIDPPSRKAGGVCLSPLITDGVTGECQKRGATRPLDARSFNQVDADMHGISRKIP